MTGRAERMLADLRSAGLKLTPQRIAIVREIADDLTHPTAQALFERLRPAFPTMSFATVYNTLDALAGCGLTGSLHLGGAVRFDPDTEPHHHAICDACGVLVDVALPDEGAPPPLTPRTDEGAPPPLTARPDEGAPPALTPRRVLESGFRVLREERIYRGLCSRCSS